MIAKFLGLCNKIFHEIMNEINASNRRRVLARMALAYGFGGISAVSRKFGVSRDTIRKGVRELKEGLESNDNYHLRGRKKITETLPFLEQDIKNIVDSQSQTDPKFESTRLYTRLTVAEIRKQLVEQKKYTEQELPTNQTLNALINKLGYKLKKVQKVKPIKKIAETDAIFDNLNKIKDEIKDNDEIVRLSIDAKDRVKIGDFSRGGKSRVEVKACDHDFGNNYVTPFGIMDVDKGTVDVQLCESKVTADCIVDHLEMYWLKNCMENKKVLVLNLDNGPENSSRRTQFIKRIIEFSIKFKVIIRLAYYPPYHSKYNPIERFWGALEQHWNGSVLNDIETVTKYIKTAKYNNENPTITINNNTYKTGKTVEKKVMEVYETVIKRTEGIEKWDVYIDPDVCIEKLSEAKLL